jgi:hypothetical protein
MPAYNVPIKSMQTNGGTSSGLTASVTRTGPIIPAIETSHTT